MKYKISVIIPIFNSEFYLRDCLDSLVNQTLGNIEILCVDDGSNDNSISIVEEYASKYAFVTLLAYEKNCGQAFARNYGLRHAQGKYVFFVDSDDYLQSNDVLSTLFITAEKENADCVIFDGEAFSEGLDNDIKLLPTLSCSLSEGLYLGKDFVKNCGKLTGNRLVVWCQFWNRIFLKENGCSFEEDTSPHEDLLFSFKMLLRVQRIFYLRKTLYRYRYRIESESRNSHSIKRLRAYFKCLCKGREFLNEFKYDCSCEAFVLSFFQQIYIAINEIIISLIIDGGFDLIEWDSMQERVETMMCILAKYQNLSRLLTHEEYVVLQNSSSVIVYGAGKVGRDVIRLLEDFGISHHILTVTKKANTLGDEGIFELDNFRGSGYPLILAVGVQYQVEMREYAKSLGFRNIISLN